MDRLHRDTWRQSMVGHIRKILSGNTRDILQGDTKKILRAVHLLRNKGCGKGGKPFYDIKSQSGKGGGVINYDIQY